MKKILACLIVIATLVASFTSCGAESVEELISKADAALLTTPYKLSFGIDIDCGDEELQSQLDLQQLNTELYFDGDDFLFNVNILGAAVKFVCVDNTIYSSYSFLGVELKNKCAVSEAERNEFLSSYLNSAMEFSALDFETVNISSSDGKTVIECSDIKSAPLEKFINSEIKNAVSGLDLNVSKVDLETVFYNGKYESITINMDNNYTYGGKTAEAGCRITMEFDYGSGRAIEAPSNLSDYIEVDFDSLLNK